MYLYLVRRSIKLVYFLVHYKYMVHSVLAILKLQFMLAPTIFVRSLARTFQSARNVSYPSGVMMRRTVGLQQWLACHCREQGYRFMDNLPSFWDRPHLLRADGLHPTGVGAAVLSSNIDRCLKQVWHKGCNTQQVAGL